jgi:hypothetical protein
MRTERKATKRRGLTSYFENNAQGRKRRKEFYFYFMSRIGFNLKRKRDRRKTYLISVFPFTV